MNEQANEHGSEEELHPELTEQQLKHAEEVFAEYNTAMSISGSEEAGTESKNMEAMLAERKKIAEEKKLQSEFKSFVEGLPRKSKRNIFPQKKFGNVLKESFRKQRLTQKHK